MKIVECGEQGSDEWLLARLGRPTASEFGKILTATGKLSEQASGYMLRLLAEWLSGKPSEPFESDWMTHGKETEQEARDYYAFVRDDAVIQRVGFCTTDDGLVGASPDALVDDDGLMEAKCPAPWTHVSYLLGDKIATKYLPQVQGQMYVTERSYCDWISYSPGIAPIIVRTERDEKYITALATSLAEFNDKLAARKLLLAKYKQ